MKLNVVVFPKTHQGRSQKCQGSSVSVKYTQQGHLYMSINSAGIYLYSPGRKPAARICTPEARLKAFRAYFSQVGQTVRSGSRASAIEIAFGSQNTVPSS